MEALTQLSNGELATRMYEVTKRYGECCMWVAEAENKIFNMITNRVEDYSEISVQVELKGQAELEKYIAMSNLKKIELEMDRRVLGESNG